MSNIKYVSNEPNEYALANKDKNYILGVYDNWLAKDVNIGSFIQINKKKYSFTKEEYTFTIVLQERAGDIFLEVYNDKHQEFIASGIVHNSLLKKKIIKEYAFFNKALVDESFVKLGISLDDVTENV